MSVREILDAQGKVAAQFLPTFIQNDLAAPVVIQAEAPATSGNPVIYVEGNAASAVGGSLALVPGSRTGALAPDAGLTIVAAPAGVQVYVGTNTQATNFLGVAGANGIAQVYDALYNQPVALQNVTFNPNPPPYPPQAGNPGEIFRTTAFTGAAEVNQFQVTKSGWYSFQSEIRVGGAGIVLPGCPITTPGTDIPGALDIQLVVQSTASAVPYSQNTVSAFSLYTQEDGTYDFCTLNRTVQLQAGVDYLVSVKGTPTAGWNLGANGQIKAELISLTP
jgi:hypothetical protein